MDDLDDELIDADYAFLNDVDAQRRLSHSLRIDQVDPTDLDLDTAAAAVHSAAMARIRARA